MIIITAKIYISDTEVIEVDRRNMLKCESLISDRSDLKMPSFGVISTTGNIKFNDNDGKILQYAENRMLVEGAKCEIVLTNTLVPNCSTILNEYETAKWDYDNENKAVTVSLKDNLQELQQINFAGIQYNSINGSPKNLAWIYEKLRTATISVGDYTMPTVEELDEKTRQVLLQTKIKYPMLNSGSLWSCWQKLCEVGQLHLYKEKGIIKCRYNGGN